MLVFLVEDDPSVALTGALLLRRLGHSVDIAQSGVEAIEWLSDPPAPPDALIVDIELPGVNGVEVLRVARELHPNAILMATSGYPLPPDLVCDVVLPKPYSARTIERCLQQVLDERGGGTPTTARPIIAPGQASI